MSNTQTAPARKSRPQHVLEVVSTEQLGPHLVRVVLTGDSLAEFTETGHTDSYVKLVFVDPALGLEPPYDVAALRETLPPEQRPVTRTYTVRSIDREARRLTLDFVTHGDTGLAAPWAQRAVPGDLLALSGPGSGYAPDPAASWHLFVGDLAAVPAIAAALEALPDDARGVAHLEIHAPDDEVPVTAPAGVDVRWLLNPDPDDVGFLGSALEEVAWPASLDGIQVFAHGERESIKQIRRVLRERDIPRDRLSISGYWARGRTEDVFQAEKREPIGKID